MKHNYKKKTWAPPTLPNGQPDFDHFSRRDWREYERRYQAFIRQLQAAGVPFQVMEVGHTDRRHELS